MWGVREGGRGAVVGWSGWTNPPWGLAAGREGVCKGGFKGFKRPTNAARVLGAGCIIGGVGFRLYRDNGKENGNDYGLGFS